MKTIFKHKYLYICIFLFLPGLTHAQNIQDKVRAALDSIKTGVTFTNSIDHEILDAIYDNSFHDEADSLNACIDATSVIGVGDIMLGTNFPSEKYLPENNACRPLLANADSILRQADVTFGNLEGSFSDNAELAKHCEDSTNCYAFRMPTQYINCIKNAGFDVVSLANNHIMDFGYAGLKETVNLLDSAYIKYAGPLQYSPVSFEKDFLSYGFCAFSPNTGTYNINDYSRLKEIVQKLDAENDIVIISFHGGAEGADHEHVPRKSERYYGENRGNVYKFAHTAVDYGADIVFGHGPHVTRAIELYKNRLICYSLGNFCTYGRFSLSGPNGIAPIVKVSVKSNGEFIGGKVYPVEQIGGGIVRLDPDKKAIRKLQKLVKADFPDTNIRVSDDGDINIIQ